MARHSIIQVAPGLPEGDRGVRRVMDALQRQQLGTAVIHVVGRRDHVRREAERLQDYVIVQYCVRSTMRPDTADWIDIWRGARLVWSYYDLPALCREDCVEPDFNFVRLPLGISSAFRDFQSRTEKRYVVVTHGTYMTESTRECIIASGEQHAHLGGLDSDTAVAAVYGASHYVSGLRRKEGFELPAAEGLACGARPILFDREHYRHWYGEHAVYVEEGPREYVLEQLREVFARRRPVMAAEMRWARWEFDWNRIFCELRQRL